MFTPKPKLEPPEVERGLKLLLVDGVSSQVMTSLTGGAFLVAYALLLGASNTVIGLIASIGPLTQALQIPAIALIERTRRRKLLAVTSSLASRSFWVLIAILPWLSGRVQLATLLTCIALYASFGTIASCAFNSWKRDLVPEKIMGRYLAQRLTLATAVSAVLTFAASAAIDHTTARFAEPSQVYSVLFAAGALFGFFGVWALSRVPEPEMAPSSGASLYKILTEPLRDTNFRKLLVFLGSWNFAVNLAAPFFSVYMIKTLGLPMRWVLGLSIASQIGNVLFYRMWGRLADRFSNKSVMGVSGWLFVLTIVAWPFTTLPDTYVLTYPLLVAIHLLAGISTAGVNLSAAGLALKAAPRGKATAFLATNAIISGAAATVAPIVAGLASDYFEGERLSLTLQWSRDAASRINLTALDLQGLDFLFVFSFVFGLYALHRLLAVTEQGEVEEDVVVGELYGEVRRVVRSVSNVAGLRQLTEIPATLVTSVRARRETKSPSAAVTAAVRAAADPAADTAPPPPEGDGAAKSAG